MQFFVGTSGYSYPKWKGSFYPKKFPQQEMLNYYAERFSTVEINNTFYKMPDAKSMEALAAKVPNSFRFAIKAPQAITHFKRLQNVEEQTAQLLQATAALKKRQGPLLFQLPPNFKKDLPRLAAFLKLLPKRIKSAFEFRHPSWLDQETFDCLQKNSCAWCVADVDDDVEASLVNTAGWGYVRLRRENYDVPHLKKWIKKIRSQPWNETYVFFKHEDTGTGPQFAARFLELLG